MSLKHDAVDYSCFRDTNPVRNCGNMQSPHLYTDLVSAKMAPEREGSALVPTPPTAPPKDSSPVGPVEVRGANFRNIFEPIKLVGDLNWLFFCITYLSGDGRFLCALSLFTLFAADGLNSSAAVSNAAEHA